MWGVILLSLWTFQLNCSYLPRWGTWINHKAIRTALKPKHAWGNNHPCLPQGNWPLQIVLHNIIVFVSCHWLKFYAILKLFLLKCWHFIKRLKGLVKFFRKIIETYFSCIYSVTHWWSKSIFAVSDPSITFPFLNSSFLNINAFLMCYP